MGCNDEISVSLRADLVHEEYVWVWRSKVYDRDCPEQVKAESVQSTFYGMPLLLPEIMKKSKSYQPALDVWGEIELFILKQMGGSVTLEEIAGLIQKRFPDRFLNYNSAFRHVCLLSGRFSK